MKESVINNTPIFQFESFLVHKNLAHAFVSKPHNYAPHRGHGAEQAIENRKSICKALQISYDNLTSPAQVHGGEVVPVEASDAGCGKDGRATAIKYVDGLVTNSTATPLILLSADCPLVCAFDSVKRAIGAVHASWQGTVAHATTQMIRVMQQTYGSNPRDIIAAIAPCAGPCCYEVREDVRRVARTKIEDAERFIVTMKSKPSAEVGGQTALDLWSANQQQLLDAGIPAEQIEIAKLCSLCDTRFWSHRRDGVTAGRSALFLALT